MKMYVIGVPFRDSYITTYYVGDVRIMAYNKSIWLSDDDIERLEKVEGDSLSSRIRKCIRYADPVMLNHYDALVKCRASCTCKAKTEG